MRQKHKYYIPILLNTRCGTYWMKPEQVLKRIAAAIARGDTLGSKQDSTLMGKRTGFITITSNSGPARR